MERWNNGNLLSEPILKKFPVMRFDHCEDDSHADVSAAIDHLAEHYDFLPCVGHFDHDLGSCRKRGRCAQAAPVEASVLGALLNLYLQLQIVDFHIDNDRVALSPTRSASLHSCPKTFSSSQNEHPGSGTFPFLLLTMG